MRRTPVSLPIRFTLALLLACASGPTTRSDTADERVAPIAEVHAPEPDPPPPPADPAREAPAPGDDAPPETGSADIPGGPGTGAGVPPMPAETMKPIKEVKANGMYTPDPSAASLAGTDAARARKPIAGTVAFCVGSEGKTTSVRIARSTSSREVDQVLVDTIRSWRFKPFLVDGKPATTCSQVVFKIAFQ